MKKYMFLIILLLTGCTNNIITSVKQNECYVYSITYPKTESYKLNGEIKKYIREKVRQIKNKDCENNINELNIDFEKNIVNNKYLNIKLITRLNDIIDSKTFVYYKNKKLSIYDILTNNDLKILNLQEDIKSFTFDDTNLYVNDTEIPLEKFDLKIKINKDIEKNTNYKYNQVIKLLDPNRPSIALTFDDGPSKYTRDIVDLLNKYDANSTFFILGNKVITYKDTLQYLLESGNEIGNHTYNHRLLTNTNIDEVKRQISDTQEIIKSSLNYTPTLFRPSYGSINNNIRNNIDLDVVLWNIDSLDWKYKNKDKILKNILPKIQNKKIILFHDTHKYTYDALKELLPYLRDNNYQIITVSELKRLNEE